MLLIGRQLRRIILSYFPSTHSNVGRFRFMVTCLTRAGREAHYMSIWWPYLVMVMSVISKSTQNLTILTIAEEALNWLADNSKLTTEAPEPERDENLL
jgi:hypothetical protein